MVQAEQPISAAEQALLLRDHLGNVGDVRTLRYVFHRGGSLESSIDDNVTVSLGQKLGNANGAVQVQFLSGERAVVLPPVENAKGNPVILSFLERDVREMQRLTKGQANYFRKRVRLALADSATVDETTIDFAGKRTKAQRITMTPYVSDPLKVRFERLAGKIYSFVLSEQVPGWVYEMRTLIKSGEDGALIEEVLTYAGAER